MSKLTKKELGAYIALFVAAIFWGTTFVAISSTNDYFPPAFLVFLRCAIGGVVAGFYQAVKTLFSFVRYCVCLSRLSYDYRIFDAKFFDCSRVSSGTVRFLGCNLLRYHAIYCMVCMEAKTEYLSYYCGSALFGRHRLYFNAGSSENFQCWFKSR